MEFTDGTDSWIENAGKGLMGKQIVKPNGYMKFLVDIFLGVKFSVTGKYEISGFNTYDVAMDDAAIVAGPYGVPAEMETKFTLELLHTDNKIRITRGYNNILFVHTRVK